MHKRSLALCFAISLLLALGLATIRHPWSSKSPASAPAAGRENGRPARDPSPVPPRPDPSLGEDGFSPATRTLAATLDAGSPLRLTAPGQAPRLFLTRSLRLFSDNFQLTVGENRSGKLDLGRRAYQGKEHIPGGPSSRLSLALVGGAISGYVRREDGVEWRLRTDGQGNLRILERQAETVTCALEEDEGRLLAVSRSKDRPVTEEDWETALVASLEPIALPSNGADPETGRLDKYVEPIPQGAIYDASLRDMSHLIALDKTVTGANTTERLAQVASEYLAKAASMAAMYENQLGIRLLIQELIMVPDDASFTDIPNSLSNYNSWIARQRSRLTYGWSTSTKFGNGAFTGGTIGVAWVSAAGSDRGVNVCSKGYGVALEAHENGHNLGSNHSAGGVMNASFTNSRDFFTDVTAGNTAAMQIYAYSRTRLPGLVPMRHPEEIPFAVDDRADTAVGQEAELNVSANDLANVRNGQTNTDLRVVEVGAVTPTRSGTAELLADGQIRFRPSPGYQGIAWFSYTLRGNVGNEGKGWLHRGDVSVEVGAWDENSLQLQLGPGQVFSFRPSGNADPTISSQPQKARVDLARDDRKLFIIRVNADAQGSDSFTFERGGSSSTVRINYLADYLQTRPDVFLHNPKEGALSFNPLANDQVAGYRNGFDVSIAVGVGSTNADSKGKRYFPGSARLLKADLLTPPKGKLTFSTRPFIVDGAKVNADVGPMTFTPAEGAVGVARIRYTVEDAAGNQQTNSVSIVLPLCRVTSPANDTTTISAGHGVLLVGELYGGQADPPLTGVISPRWSVARAPVGAEVNFDNRDAAFTGATFSQPGVYVLRLTGMDSGYSTFDEVTVTVAPDNASTAPQITWDATRPVVGGSPFDLGLIRPAVTAGAGGSATRFSTLWEHLSGPKPATFAAPNSLKSEVSFPVAGDYTLRLRANAGSFVTFRDLAIRYTGGGDDAPFTLGLPDIVLPKKSAERAFDLTQIFGDADDPPSALRFTLTANSFPGLFSKSEIAGNSLLLSVPDGREGASDLTVRAMDPAGGAIEATFRVIVRNEPPRASDQSFSLEEGAQAATDVGTVVGLDPEGGTLTYEIVSGNELDAFTLDRNTGQLRVATPFALDFETRPSFSLAVKLAERANPASFTTAKVLVRLTDRNEPPLIQDQSFSVSNRAPVGETVGVISAADPEGGVLSFRIVDGNAGDAFTLTEDGKLLVRNGAAFDVERQPRFFLTIRAEEPAPNGLSTQAIARVTLEGVLVGPSSPSRWTVPANADDEQAWRTLAYGDGAWKSGKAALGYDRGTGYDSLIQTDVEASLYTKEGALYSRIPFTLPDPAQVGALTLRMKYDDGFFAWINGATAARDLAPAEPAWNSRATAARDEDEAKVNRDFDLSGAIFALRAGNNVLALQGLNSRPDSNDLLLAPELVWTPAGTAAYPNPPSLENLPATEVDKTSAKLSYKLISDGGAKPFARLHYGRTDGGTTPESWEFSKDVAAESVVALTGLKSGQRYFYRFSGSNSGGVAWTPASGEFTTLTPVTRVVLVADKASARVRVPVDATLDAVWRELDFDDSLWTPGTLAAGYERETGYERLFSPALNLANAMYNKSQSAYLRAEFSVADPKRLSALRLLAHYDDGFIAYLNGVEIARANAPALPTWESGATANHEADINQPADVFDVSAKLAHLRAGKNVLAIHALNFGKASSDFLMAPSLIAEEPDSPPPPPKPTYADWAAGYPGVGDMAENVDGDALANLLEYAFGTDPTKADGPVLDISAGRAEQARFASLTFPRRVDRELRGLRYVAEISPTMEPGSWTVVKPDQETVLPAGELELVRWRIAWPDDAARFARLRVELAE